MSSKPPDDPARDPLGVPLPDSGVGPASVAWDRVNERLHEALGLPPESREAFLSRLALADHALGREVRSLLAAHEASEDFLSESPAFEAVRAAFVGDRLGPYRIVEEIGHGGMGVVFRARREDDSFTKDVAIKLIDPGLRSEPILRRFRDERQILALLEHPNIARLLDGGTAADGAPYLVMEYVEGVSLLEYCDTHRLNVNARLALFLQVCDAVQFAHQRLVVHRDLKSDNVLVTAEGSPRLLDFGIAKLLAADGGSASGTLTAPMHRLLTPDYASPEQIRGEPAAVASDVYSLGVILYELLTGVRPLHFTTRLPEEILRVALQDEARPPSATMTLSGAADLAKRRGTQPRLLRRELTGDLDFIALKALEKDVARRYASVDALARDLRRYMSGHPVLARGQSTTYRLSRFVRRNRAAVLAGALVTLTLVAGLAGTTWQASVARRERDRAQRRFDDVTTLAHAVMFDLHDAIANLPGSTKARETLVLHALRYLDRLREDSEGDAALQRELAVAYAKVADVQGRPMFPNLGQSAPALVSYDKALALFEVVTRAWPESTDVARNLIVTATRRADLLGTMGRDSEALTTMLTTRQRLRTQIASHPRDTLLLGDLALICDRLFDMRLAAGDTAGALAEFREGLALVVPMYEADPRDAASRRAILIRYAKGGALHSSRGQRDSAQASYMAAERLALEAVQALPNDTEASRDLSVVYAMRASFLAECGALDSALIVYQRGMRITEHLAAADPDNALQQADLALGHMEIGGMLLDGGRHRDAETSFAEAATRFARLATADTANADYRKFTRQSCEQASSACQALAAAARSPLARQRWRKRAAEWRARAEGYAGPASEPVSSR